MIADQSTHKNFAPEAPFTSDKIKINTLCKLSASFLLEGEYCRLIRVSVVIVDYVQFRLKLNLEAILESKAILLQKLCSGHQNERIALGLCQPRFVKKLDCRFFISCNIRIGSVTHVAGKFVTWASFTSSLKLQIHPRQVPRLRAANILLTRRTKPAQHGENQNPSVSLRGQQTNPRSKVPRRLLKANQESLSPFLFWRRLKNLKGLFSLILTSKEVKQNALIANKTNELGPA